MHSMYSQPLHVGLLVLSIMFAIVYPLPEGSQWHRPLLAAGDTGEDQSLHDRESLPLGAIELLDPLEHYARMAAPSPPFKASPPRTFIPSIPTRIKTANSQKPQPQAIQKSMVQKNDAAYGDRTPCSPELCPKYCERSDNSSAISRFHPRNLFKRFFEIPNVAGAFVDELLQKDYCDNLTLNSTKYVWHAFAEKDYAAAMKGMCGCTGIFIASENGAFTAHIWEKDTKTNADLGDNNYNKTLQALKQELSPHKADLKGGVAFIMLPGKYNNTDVYSQKVYDAIRSTVKDASGLNPVDALYIPLNANGKTDLGNNQNGTGAVLYDPKYKNSKDKNATEVRAFRIYVENQKLAEVTWPVKVPQSNGTGPSIVQPVIPPVIPPVVPPSQPTCNPLPNGHYQDAHIEAVHAASQSFCTRDAAKVVHDKQVRIGDDAISKQHAFGNDAADDNYVFKISSVDGCLAPDGYNLGEPVKGFSCEQVMFTAWEHCYNDGRGGTITAGCLTYGIHPRY